MNANTELVRLNTFQDSRGKLISLEKNQGVPFEIRRVYYIFNNSNNERRGFHAHIKLRQLLICLSGNCKVKCIYKDQEIEYQLNSPDKGLLIEGLVWREMFDFSDNCILLVLASEYYDPSDYIRDFKLFLMKQKDE